MANREVNLTKRVETPHGCRYCRVVLSANGRVKPDVVIVNKKEERHPEGAYYLEWREGGKRVRLSVGKDAADANARRLRKEAELNAMNNGIAVVPESGNGHRSLAAAVTEYLEETKVTKKAKTHAAYSTALTYFQESCHKLFLHEIERRDLLKFSAFLRDEKEQSPRSTYNKFVNVMTFLKAQGIRGLVGKNDWPRFTEEEPEIYEGKYRMPFSLWAMRTTTFLLPSRSSSNNSRLEARSSSNAMRGAIEVISSRSCRQPNACSLGRLILRSSV
jgi:integrase/recombinase XerD